MSRQEEIDRVADILLGVAWKSNLKMAEHLVDNGIRSAEGFELLQHGLKFYEEDTFYTIEPIDYSKESK